MSKKTYPRCVCGFPAEFPENDPKTCGRDGCTDSPAATDHPKDFTQSFDARDWARAFVGMVRTNPSIATDESTMIGWFANALMRGFDEKRSSSMTNQIAPSLATELEQAVGGSPEWLERIPAISVHPDSASTQEVAELAAELMEARALLTRAAALARAAEKLAEAQLMDADYDRQFISCPVCGIFRSMEEEFEHAPDCEWMALRALVSSEGKGE